MNLKFLPIGTVCLVNSIGKKQMIIGYSKSGYDYIAVEYPKGFESDMKLSYFNHDEVKELYSLGYKNEESRIFNGTLVSVLTSNILDEEEVEQEKLEADDSSLAVFHEERKVEQVDDNLEQNASSYNVFQEPKKEEFHDFEERKIDTLPELEEMNSDDKNEIPQEIPFEMENVKLQDDGVILSGGMKIGRILKTTDRLRGIIMADEGELEESDEEREEFSPIEEIEEVPFENKVEEIPPFEEVSPEIISGLDELEQAEPEEENFSEVTDLEVKNDLPLDDETIDISTMVKKIEETMSEKEEDNEAPKRKPKKKKKKEKWGLFHFGKK